jgi:hypothetical protein
VKRYDNAWLEQQDRKGRLLNDWTLRNEFGMT